MYIQNTDLIKKISQIQPENSDPNDSDFNEFPMAISHPTCPSSQVALWPEPVSERCSAVYRHHGLVGLVHFQTAHKKHGNKMDVS